jgi:mono/diheme cytochrome c family protein
MTSLRPRLLFALLLLAVPACYQKMAVQPPPRPLASSDFFPDGRASRAPVTGTVARGQLRTDRALYEGTVKDAKDGKADVYVTEFPFEITESVLKRGEQRFNVFCSVCHGLTGWGDGRIVQRGFTRPPSFLYEVNDKWLLADAKNQPLSADGSTFRYGDVAGARQAKVKLTPSLSRGYKLRQQEMALSDAPVGYFYHVITRGYGAMPDYAEQIPTKDRWAIAAYVRTLQYSQMPELRERMKKADNKGDKK